MSAFIKPPAKMPLIFRAAMRVVRKYAGKDLLLVRLLAWYPKVAVSSGVLEALIAHQDGKLDERILKLVRLQASFAVACPFCIDMNARGFEGLITTEELQALHGLVDLQSVESFSTRERLALQYTRLISSTPLSFPRSFIEQLTGYFNEREIVILASTAAQVNYWARLIQALGVPTEGFLDKPDLYLQPPVGLDA